MNKKMTLILLLAIAILGICYTYKYYLNSNNQEKPILKEDKYEAFYKEHNIDEDKVVKLGNDYATSNNYDGVIYDFNTNSITNVVDTIIDKDKFYNILYEKLRTKYPKFVVDEIIKQSLNVTYMDDKKMSLVFDKSSINPPIPNEVTIDLLCNDYQSNIKFKCTETTEELPKEERDPNRKVVALTFDDGPCKYTFEALEELKNNNMRATFFELGSMMNSYPDAVKAVYESDNEVASHGYSHTSFIKLGAEKVNNELVKTNEIFKSITGADLTMVRPPYGSINANVKENVNTIFIKWSVDSLDWKEKDKFIDNIMSTVGDGDIILMHDIHKTTVDGLSTLLPLLYSQGYDVVTVSELASIKGVNLENNKIYFKINNE